MMKSMLRAVKNVFGSSAKKPARSRPFRRTTLNLEELEARDCPAIVHTVTGLGDAGAGMGNMGYLKYCITQANATSGADTIQFQQGLSGEINPANPYAIAADLTITGPGTDKIQIRGVNAVVTQNKQLVLIDTGVTGDAISGLTFERGFASVGAGGKGGAIENRGGNLTVNNCWFGYNRAASGGAIFNGENGSLTASGCIGGGIALESGTMATIGGATDFGKNEAMLGGAASRSSSTKYIRGRG